MTKKDFDFIGLLKNIALSLGGGIIVGLLTKGTMDTYDKLKKPIFAPPNIVFPIVWIILYILIGVAAYRIYEKNKKGFDDNEGTEKVPFGIKDLKNCFKIIF